MIHAHQVGAARISGIVEYYGPTHSPEQFSGFDRADLDHNAGWLVPRYYVPHMDRLVLGITIWLVQIGDQNVLVDTGFGSGKARATPRANMLNTLAMSWLEAAGASPDSITSVIHTHLHSDHVGGNTVPSPDGWTAGFVNAQHYFPRADYEHFSALHAQVPPPSVTAGFGDSVLPIMDAGRGSLFQDGDVLLDLFRVEAAPGHTPGMVSLWLESEGQQGVFCADVFHHPIQIGSPGWASPMDMDEAVARRTRIRLLERLADSGTLVLPTHFPPPGCGFVRRTERGFAFQPAE